MQVLILIFDFSPSPNVHVADVLGVGKHFKPPLPTVSFLFPRIFSSHHYIRPAFSDPFIKDQLQNNDFSFCHGSFSRMIIWQGTTGRTSVQPQEDLSTQRNLLGTENIVRVIDRVILNSACLKFHQFLVSCLSPRKSNICFSSYMT